MLRRRPIHIRHQEDVRAEDWGFESSAPGPGEDSRPGGEDSHRPFRNSETFITYCILW